MSVLSRLRGGLVVSVQAPRGSPLDDPLAIAAIAAAACEAGAVGLRIASVLHLKAVRARLDVPIVGIIKREYPGFAPYITPTISEVREIVATGADIVAFDATARARADGSTIEEIVAEIHRGGAIAMADCAVENDGRRATDAGCDIVATTLCGYTDESRGATLPALDLVRALATFAAFVVCEGGITEPASGRAALEAGAHAIVVGTAITGVARRTQAFAQALR
jgi:N-acylglucosamine-6-phosphate 2-epimerase